jgi:hypothetical protein
VAHEIENGQSDTRDRALTMLMLIHVTRPSEASPPSRATMASAATSCTGTRTTPSCARRGRTRACSNPGDRVVTPTAAQDGAATTDTRQRFTVKLAQPQLRLKLLDARGHPIAGEPYTVTIGDDRVPRQTDGRRGLLQRSPCRPNHRARVWRDQPMMDTPDKRRGARERLGNLGGRHWRRWHRERD